MKINTNKTSNYFLLFFAIILLHLKITSSKSLSLCTKGSFSYTSDSSIKSKTCSLPEITTGEKIYPASINKAFFNSYEKCGICYEMVGPFGAVKLRVEDTNEDIDDTTPFFKLGSQPSFTLMNVNNTNDLSESKTVGVSFRMVSCDYSEKIKILTGENNYQGFSFSCLVYNNNIPISFVQIKEKDATSFTEIKKASSNFYSYDKGDLISYPIILRIISITGEIVNVTISSKESDETYETSGNFYNPDNYYFNTADLKRVKTSTTENCCSIDFSDYSNIYTNGEINKNYETATENAIINNSTNEQITNIKLNNNGKLYIKSKMPIRADQFIGVSLSLKANKICKDCLYISSYDKLIENKISIQQENTLKSYNYLFNSLNVNDNTFIGIVLFTKNNDIEIGISEITLMENSDAPNTEICLGNSSSWIPVVPTHGQTTIVNIATTYTETNGTQYTNINILNVTKIINKMISVQSEPFTKLENENIKILFISNDGDSTKNFETDNCFINGNNPVNSFICYIPDSSKINNGIYKLNSPEENLYKINSEGTVSINNGNIIYQNKIEPIEPTSTNNKQIIESTSIFHDEKIIITDSIDKIINKGETVEFKIAPISKIIYNIYGLDQIIFTDGRARNPNALYLKNCNPIISSDINQSLVESISCIVSNNIVRGNYISLANGQDISIAEGKTVNLTCNNSYGGSFSTDMSQTINANISKKEKLNYSINFGIIYYDQNLKPNDLFPYQVFLYGNKKSSKLRNLDSKAKYGIHFLFPNCTMGSYISSLNRAMSGINCNLPDFVEAGEYSKIVSNGFDVNPNQKINISFPYDFNKSENYIKSNSSSYYPEVVKKSSSSKTWIIWLVLGILVAVLIVIIIIAFCMNRKKNKASNDNDDVNNSNNSNNRIDNSIDSNNGRENNENNNNNNSNETNNNNNISTST